MKKAKKIVSIIMAVLMLCSMSAFFASAEEDVPTEYMAVTLSTNLDQVPSGTTITVTLNIRNNYNATTMRWPVMFPTDIFEVPSSLSLKAAGTFANLGGTLSANTTGVDSLGESIMPEGYDSGKYGMVLIQWVAKVSGSTGVSTYQSTAGQDCIKFNLKVKDNAGKVRGPNGEDPAGTIFIPSNSDLFYYQAMKDNSNQGANTIYKIPTNCTKTFIPKTVYIDKIVDYGIELASGSTATIDTDRKLIYGVEEMVYRSEMPNYVVPVGHSILDYGSDNSDFGTGSPIYLKDATTREVVDEYALIIFGDVTGDGFVDESDNEDILKVVRMKKFYDDGTAELFAGDICDADEFISEDEYERFLAIVRMKQYIVQTDPYTVYRY